MEQLGAITINVDPGKPIRDVDNLEIRLTYQSGHVDIILRVDPGREILKWGFNDKNAFAAFITGLSQAKDLAWPEEKTNDSQG